MTKMNGRENNPPTSLCSRGSEFKVNKKSCEEANAFYRKEYDKIKAHITELAQAVLFSAYNNTGLNKLPPDARLRVVIDILVKRLSKDFQVSEAVVRDWLLFDYITELTKIDLK